MSQDILLSLIDPDPEQPRKHFDTAAIEELAQSLTANGLAVPILLRPVGNRFLIVHGERRWRAAQSLKWQTIRAEVRDVSPDEARWLALVENVQRADLSPMEEAEAYRAHLAEGITQVELGKRIGKSQSYIAQKLRLLTLPAAITSYIKQGLLTEGHARQLLKLRNLHTPTETHELSSYVRRAEGESTDDVLLKLATEDNGIAFVVLGPIMLDDIHPFQFDPPMWFNTRPEGRDTLHYLGSPPDPDVMQARFEQVALCCAQFYLHIWEKQGIVLRWETSAFWWASFAAYTDMSVADLAGWIDAVSSPEKAWNFANGQKAQGNKVYP